MTGVQTCALPISDELVLLAHEQLEHGRTIPVPLESERPSPSLDELQLASADRVWVRDDYRDPVPSFEGRWLAGLAPVGGTGLVIVVQTRHGIARVAERVGLLFGVPAVLGAALIGALRWRRRR